MNILGLKCSAHDGTVCYLSDGELVFSIEGEKDSGPRHAVIQMDRVGEIVKSWDCSVEVVCGDSRQFAGPNPDNYMGITSEEIFRSESSTETLQARYISIPHEMAHIACSYALSDLPERQPFYALVWEGYIGRFYRVDAGFQIRKLGSRFNILDSVGRRYSIPYHATGRSPDVYGHAAAGKIMALAGLADPARAQSLAGRKFVTYLLDCELLGDEDRLDRLTLDGSQHVPYELFAKFSRLEVTDPDFVAICKALQDCIFERFHSFAESHMKERLPLVISGGCGLNCDWNTMWRDSGLFESVFVPPVPGDCGVALGAAAVVQHLKTERMKLKWNVYAGEPFVNEALDFAHEGFLELPLNYDTLTDWLFHQQMVVAWIQGRYEIGPRALCHRSLIAAPFTQDTQRQLNTIKRREHFRPVAPVCLEEDVAKHFDWTGASPYMLYFQKVKDKSLAAVTHLDGTARVQTVNRSQDPATYELLTAFREKSGSGVLCNTSLNFLGCGFINRTSHLVRYVKETGIPAFVINNKMYICAQKHAVISRSQARPVSQRDGTRRLA
jgi:hydroxymethyl cephem carbamoyltransferase